MYRNVYLSGKNTHGISSSFPVCTDIISKSKNAKILIPHLLFKSILKITSFIKSM